MDLKMLNLIILVLFIIVQSISAAPSGKKKTSNSMNTNAEYDHYLKHANEDRVKKGKQPFVPKESPKVKTYEKERGTFKSFSASGTIGTRPADHHMNVYPRVSGDDMRNVYTFTMYNDRPKNG